MAWNCYYVHYLDTDGRLSCIGVFAISPQCAVDRFRLDYPFDVKVVKVTIETRGFWS